MVRVYKDMDEVEENLEFIPGLDSKGKLCLDVCLDGKKVGVIDKDKKIKIKVRIAEEESDADRIKYGGISLYDYSVLEPVDENYKSGERMITPAEAWYHYVQGSKEPLTVKLEFLDMSRFAPAEGKVFLKAIAPYYRKKGVFEVSAELEYDTKSLVIGHHNMRVKGKLTSDHKKWLFKGTYESARGYDRYNFNKSTHRGFWGELATTALRNAGGENAKEYDINIPGKKIISFSRLWDE